MTMADIAAPLAKASAGDTVDLAAIAACAPLCKTVFAAGSGASLRLASAPDTSPDGAAMRIRGSASLMGVTDADLSLVFAEDIDGVSTHLRASMPAGESIPIPGLTKLRICDIALFFDVSSTGLITGRLAGSVPFGEDATARMPLCVELPISSNAWAFFGGAEAASLLHDEDDDAALPSQIPLTLAALCERLSLPSLAHALPEGLNDVGLTSFSFGTDGHTLTSLAVGIATVPAWAWELEPGLRLDRLWAATAVTDPTGTPGFLVSLGGRLTLGGGRLELLADGSRSWQGGSDGAWKLHAVAIAPVEITTGVSIEDVALTLSRSGKTWNVGGSVDLKLLDHDKPIQLTVDTTIARAAGEVRLSAKKLDLPLLTLPAWNGALVLEDASCTIRGHQDAPAGGRTLAAAFELEATARLTWTGGLLRGKLRVSTDEAHPQLRFEIDGDAAITLPAPSGLTPPQIVLSKLHADISRENGSGWQFDGGTTFRFAELSPRIQAALPAMTFDLTLTSASMRFIARNPPGGLSIPLPHTQGSKPKPLGAIGLKIEELTLEVSKTGLTFDTTVGVTLPSEINGVFGGRKVFVTGKELGVRFIAGLIEGQPGFSVDLLALPFTAFQPGADGRVHWDLGGAGEIDFTIPKIVCTTGTFTVNVSVHENPQRPLQLPLVLIKHALGLRLPAAVVNEIPDYLPLRSPSLFTDPEAGKPSTLKAPEFIQRFHLTGEAADAAGKLATAMDRLPDRFKDYLRGQGPTGLDLNLSITPTGSVSLDLSLDAQPVKVLFPAGAEIIGIELKSISFGEVLGGALFELRLDASIDTFDILALAVCVSGAAGGVPALDYLSTMRDTLIAEKLLAFIVYETGIPVPIPLFCNRLGVDYKGLLGVEAKTSWSFPEPTVDLASFFAEAKGLWDFVSVPAAKFPTAIGLPFALRESYIALPPYLGRDRYIGVKGADVFHGDAATLVAHVADGIKFFSLYDALLAIPIAERIGTLAITLGPLAVDAQWLVCTPREFHDNLTPKTAAVPSALAPVMALAPADKLGFLSAATSGSGDAIAATDERRIVILLAGGIGVNHGDGLHASFALVAGGRHGLYTSVRITGALAGAIAVDLHGSIESEARDAHGDESFVIHASGQILVGKHPLLVVNEDARSANGTITFHGDLKVLPDMPELTFSARGHASLSADAFAVGGSVHVAAMGLHGDSTFNLGPQTFQCTEEISAGLLFSLWSGTLRISGKGLGDRKHLTVSGSVAEKSLSDALTTQVSNAVSSQLTIFERQLRNAINGLSKEGWVAWTVGGGAIEEAYLELLHEYVLALQAAIAARQAIGSFEGRVIAEIARRLGPFGAVVPYLTGQGFVVSLTRASFTASLDDGIKGKVSLTLTGSVTGAPVGPWTFSTDLSSVAAIATGLVKACFGSGVAVAGV